MDGQLLVSSGQRRKDWPQHAKTWIFGGFQGGLSQLWCLGGCPGEVWSASGQWWSKGGGIGSSRLKTGVRGFSQMEETVAGSVKMSRVGMVSYWSEVVRVS